MFLHYLGDYCQISRIEQPVLLYFHKTFFVLKPDDARHS